MSSSDRSNQSSDEISYISSVPITPASLLLLLPHKMGLLNRVSDKIIEACECLKAWWRQGVVTGATPEIKMKKRKADEMEQTTEEIPDYLIGQSG
jgi:hypothetical protein